MEIFVGLEAEPQDVCRGKRRWEKRKVYKGLKRSCVHQDIEERLDIVISVSTLSRAAPPQPQPQPLI